MNVSNNVSGKAANDKNATNVNDAINTQKSVKASSDVKNEYKGKEEEVKK